MVLLQVEDSLDIGTSKFVRDEERASKNFSSNPRNNISPTSTMINGRTSTLKHGTISTTQTETTAKLKIEDTDKAFASQRALAQYIVVSVRPDVCAPVQLLSLGNSQTTSAQYKDLEKSTTLLRKTHTQRLNFVPLEKWTNRMVLLTDSSFANSEGLKGQLGYVILLVGDSGACNILHYGRHKCKCDARSVMAAEVQSLVIGFEFFLLIRNLAQELVGQTISFEETIDSRMVLKIIAKDANT